MSAKEVIFQTIAQAFKDKGWPPRAIQDSDLLGAQGLGLDSLDMATIVAELDAKLHIDPFAHGTPQFHTVGDFIRLFESEP